MSDDDTQSESIEGHSERYDLLTQLEHVHKAPDMYGAVTEICTKREMLISPAKKITYEDLSYSPMWLKMVDEIIVNACDQKSRYPKKVTEIDIVFDLKQMSISVRNNGPSIAIEKHKKHNMYNAQMIFCEFLSGSNFERKHNKTTGGKNGIGAKLTNAFSEYFIIECVNKKKKYTQHIEDCMRCINEPSIEKYDGPDSTCITFKPDYKLIGYTEKITKDVKESMMRLLYTRAIYCSISTGIACTLNEHPVCITSMRDIALAEHSESSIIEFIIKDSSEKKLHWNVIIALIDDGPKQLSLVNGIHVRKGGSNIKHIINQIAIKYKEKIKKQYNITKWDDRIISKFLYIYVNMKVEDPRFDGQAKEELQVPSKFGTHDITPGNLKKIYEGFKDLLDEQYNAKKADKKTRKKEKVDVEKYTPAKYAGTAKSAECTLKIVEGDSASLLDTSGMSSEGVDDKHGPQYCGLIMCAGKPMNARKMVDIKNVRGHRKIIRNDKLKLNKFWTGLVDVLGLDYTYTYAGPDAKKQLSELRYGRVVVIVDQDVDGVGHIFGLLLNHFHLFWPELIRIGFIKRLATPIVIAYPKAIKTSTLSFYSETEYENWCKEKFGSLELIKGYTIKYFKGLASHDEESAAKIYRNFDKQLYTYIVDDETDELFEIYFGDDTDKRKKELLLGVITYKPDGKFITCSQQLRCETKEYQLEDILRSMPHIYDGLRPAARIVLAGARKKFVGLETTKTVQFAGYISEKLGYHHGDQSLCDVVNRSAQGFPGARNLPLLYGAGQFGTRKDNKYGSPRYTCVGINRALVYALFPVIDDYIVPYNFTDGERCEPLYYIPVLPLAILESFTSPATGWATKIWARNYDSVLANVKKMICGTTQSQLEPMGFWMRNNEDCHIKETDIAFIQTGTYIRHNKDTIIVTSLPLGVFNKKWIEDLDWGKDSNIANVCDESKKDTRIVIRFEKGVLDTIEDIEKYLHLSITCNSLLNCYCDGTVLELKSYVDMLMHWFEARKNLYYKRLERQRILLKWQIIMLEQMIRYADNYSNYNLANKSREKCDAILAQNDYKELNKAHIDSPAYVDIKVLDAYMIDEASYDYLLGMSDLVRMKEPNTKRRALLVELKKDFDKIRVTTPALIQEIWLSEVDKCDEVISKGLKHGWRVRRNDVRDNDEE